MEENYHTSEEVGDLENQKVNIENIDPQLEATGTKKTSFINPIIALD